MIKLKTAYWTILYYCAGERERCRTLIIHLNLTRDLTAQLLKTGTYASVKGFLKQSMTSCRIIDGVESYVNFEELNENIDYETKPHVKFSLLLASLFYPLLVQPAKHVRRQWL